MRIWGTPVVVDEYGPDGDMVLVRHSPLGSPSPVAGLLIALGGKPPQTPIVLASPACIARCIALNIAAAYRPEGIP